MRSPLAVVPLAMLIPAAANAGVVVNELFPDPSSTDEGHEWIELYNAGSSDEDLSSWTIEAGTSSYKVVYTIPSGTTLAPGDWLLIGDELVTGADLNLASGSTLGLGNASNADAVRVKDAGGTVQDTVVYGSSNTDAWADDTGATATSLAPFSSGKAIARNTDGIDTNASAADFSTTSTPTPNASNGTGGGDTDTDTEPPIDCVADQVVKINELIFNPSGTDTGQEWLELFNPGSSEVDVSGYQIAAGTSSYKVQTTLPADTTIPAGGFLVIGGSLVTDADLVSDALELGNASNADAVRVQDCYGAVIDTVVYGTDNTADSWTDDTGAVAASLAPVAKEGRTLARVTDGVDTDQCGVDFEQAAYATLGLSNDSPPVDCGGPASELKINEVFPDPAGADEGFEWVELYNAGAVAIDLTGWSVESATSDTWSEKVTFDAITLSPGDWLLVGEANVVGADVTVEGTLGLPNGTHGDGIRVVDCEGFPADTVVYGADNEDLIVDDSGGVATSLASDPEEGSSLQRREDGLDTDECAADFALQAAPTPGASNPVVEVDPCVPSQGTVVLNELMSDPDGSDEGLEWFELYNRSDVAVSLSGWWVSTATQTDDLGNQDVVFGAGTSIAPGGFFVVGGAGTEFADLVKTFSIGNGTGGDAMRLYDCEGNAVDTVIYGDDNEDGLLDDGGEPADPYGDPGSNQTLARTDDGLDNDVADDWFVDLSPTPGETNYQEPVVDTGDDGPGGKGCGKRPDDEGAPSGGCGSRPDGSISGLVLLGLLWRRRQR